MTNGTAIDTAAGGSIRRRAMRGMRATILLALAAAALLAAPSVALAAPVTALESLPASAVETWVAGDVLVGLRATGGDGVVEPIDVRYVLDGGAAQSFSETLTVSGQGVHRLAYWSVDASGTSETTRTATIRIDNSAPQTISTVGGPFVRMAPLRLYSYDGLSGVARMEYNFNGGPWKLGPAVILPGAGTFVFGYRAIDHAGNVEATKFVTITTDGYAPRTTSDARSSYVGRAIVHLRALDSQSGVAETRWSLDGKYWYRGLTATIAKGGTYTFRFRSVDHAGNIETVRKASVYVSKYSVTIQKWPSSSSYTMWLSDGVAYKTFTGLFKTTTGLLIRGKSVRLQRSTNGVTWTTVYTLTTNSSGKASRRVAFTKAGTTYWRWYSPTTGSYKSAHSARTRMVIR